MKTTLLAAGLVAGLALANSETFAAGPMITPGALATTSVGSAEAIVEKTVVVVRRRAVVRRPDALTGIVVDLLDSISTDRCCWRAIATEACVTSAA